jgi:hypothetical protein
MAWFDDIQKGIYSVVGMIDPSDPGYQGMLKAQQADMARKLTEEQIATSQINRATATGYTTGYGPNGMKFTDTSGMARLLSDVNSGRPLNQAVSNNMMQMLIGGLSPAEVAMGSLTPQQAQQASLYASKLQQTPQELAANDIQKAQLEDNKLYRQELIKDREAQRDISRASLAQNERHWQGNNALQWAGLDIRKEQARDANKYTDEHKIKDWKDMDHFFKETVKITGGTDSNPGMSVDVAANHVMRNYLMWAPQAARLIQAGNYSYDKLANDLSAAILNGGSGLGEQEKAKANAVVQKIMESVQGMGKGKGYAVNPNIAGMSQSFLSDVAKQMGLNGEITSGYRDPEYNAEVGGVPNSLHTQGRALDFVFPGMSPEQEARLLHMAKVYGFTESLFHDVGSGRHLHLGL